MDNNLEFWFRKLTDDSPPIGRIICLLEKDDVYHVETKIRGRFFSATPEYGVRYADIIATDPSEWDVVSVPEHVTDEVVAWCQSILGAKYDYFGAFNSAMGIPLRDPNKWFCSLCGEEVASRSGIGGLDPLPDPSTLRMQLKSGIGMIPVIDSMAVTRYPIAGLAFADRDLSYINSLVASNLLDADTAQKVIGACQRGTA